MIFNAISVFPPTGFGYPYAGRVAQPGKLFNFVGDLGEL